MDSIFEKIIVFGTHTEWEDGLFLSYFGNEYGFETKPPQLKGIKCCQNVLYSILCLQHLLNIHPSR